jgi:hypothetical protein|tara:strand:+ start:771 stop:1100 length:330 start_codon:yes stop_codon:yes gene_type:complete
MESLPKNNDSISPREPDVFDNLEELYMDDLDRKELRDKVFKFERKLDNECGTYGWGRGLRTACRLYQENLELENKMDQKNQLIEEYKSLLRIASESKKKADIDLEQIDE